MKKIIIISLATLVIGYVQADYKITIKLEDHIKFSKWSFTDPLLGDWVDIGEIHDCYNWTPETSSITINQGFTQISNDCKQNQSRTVQDRKLDTLTGSVQNVGSPYTETKQITAMSSRESFGIKKTWITASSIYTDWVNTGDLRSCSNWSPSTTSMTIGQSFNQTATDCKQDQNRFKQEREQETTTFEIRNTGTATVENNTITVSNTRNAVGTKDCRYDRYSYNWNYATTLATTITWNGQVVFYDNWTPEASYYPSVDVNGFRYTRSSTSSDSPGILYAVCKTPL